MDVRYTWRGEFENAEVNALHAEGFGHRVLEDDWSAQVQRYSLGWVCARDGDDLIGWVNVPWDGGVHAFILDTLVASRMRRHGIGRQMIVIASEEARAAGCEALHVDFGPELTSFYIEACGFTPTPAGLMQF